MKKKILLISVLVIATLCLLAVSVGAEELKPHTTNEYGDLTVFDTAIGNTDISQNKNDGTIARSVIYDGTNYYTIPTTYYTKSHSMNRDGISGHILDMDFTALNAKFNELGGEGASFNFTKNSVIRCELPDEVKFINNDKTESFSGCTGIVEFLGSDGLRIWDNGQHKVFANCTALVSVDLSGMIIDGSNGLFAMFEGCTELESVKLPTPTVDVDISYLFNGCTNLTTIENLDSVLEHVTFIGQKAFLKCPAKFNLVLSDRVTSIGTEAFKESGITGTLIIPDNVTSIGQNAFRESGITGVSTPAGITYNSNYWDTFRNCTSLEWVDMSRSNSMTKPYDLMFDGCSALKVVILNDNLKDLGKQSFGNCTSLEFLYLPAGLESLGTSGSWSNGAFYNCQKLYFVAEKYDLDDFLTDGALDNAKYTANKIARPDIYYIPEGVTSHDAAANPFRNCYNINPTLVFGENFTSINDEGFTFAYMGKNEAKNVVFLGQLTTFKYSNAYQNIHFYFVNLGKDDLTLNGVNSSGDNCHVYFCGETGHYVLNNATPKWVDTEIVAHLFEKAAVTDATCTEPSMSADFCFCGTAITEPVTVGDALGHNHDASVEANVSYVYTSLIANGTKYVKCVRCDDKTDSSVPAPFGTQGMSITTDGYAQGYGVNKEALANYISVNGISSYEFGVIAGSYRQIGGNAPINADGTTYNDKTHKFNYKDTDYTMFDIKIKGITEGYADEGVILCAYVILDGTVYYISNNVASTEPAYYSYNDVNDIVNATVPETVDYMYNEEDIA